MNVLEQGVVDQRLVVPAPGFVHLISEVLQYGVGQPNRDLRLSLRPASCGEFEKWTERDVCVRWGGVV
jgi:hypothetical protein